MVSFSDDKILCHQFHHSSSDIRLWLFVAAVGADLCAIISLSCLKRLPCRIEVDNWQKCHVIHVCSFNTAGDIFTVNIYIVIKKESVVG